MKPAVLFTTLLLAAAALPASAQHSASGTIAPAPGAAALSAAAPAVPAIPAIPAATTAPSAAVTTAAVAPPAAGPAPAGAAEQAAAKTGSAMVLPAAALPAAPAMPAASSSAGSLLQTTLALAFVLALLVGLAWLLKRYGPKSMGSSSAVRLVGSLSVGARERILVLEVGEQWIVVGASPGRMNALATMPRQAQDEFAGNAAPALPGANFAEWFKQTIEKRNGK